MHLPNFQPDIPAHLLADLDPKDRYLHEHGDGGLPACQVAIRVVRIPIATVATKLHIHQHGRH